MARGQTHGNREKKKPKADKNAAKPSAGKPVYTFEAGKTSPISSPKPKAK